MRAAFGLSLEQYLYFGGYPGAAPLVGEPGRWARYIIDSLIETTISRMFCCSPGSTSRCFLAHVRSWDAATRVRCSLTPRCSASSTTPATPPRWRTILTPLAAAGLLKGLPKFAGQTVRQRGSSPKPQAQHGPADGSEWLSFRRGSVGSNPSGGDLSSPRSAPIWPTPQYRRLRTVLLARAQPRALTS